MKTQKHGGEGQSAPPNRDPVLHFHALRLIALRGGDRNEETPKAEYKRGILNRVQLEVKPKGNCTLRVLTVVRTLTSI